jgi:hypothetical protein
MSYTGDGHDYDVVHNGTVIDNIKAMTDAKALKIAKQIWGDQVTVQRSK